MTTSLPILVSILLTSLICQIYSFTPSPVEWNLQCRKRANPDNRCVRTCAQVLPQEDRLHVANGDQLNSEVEENANEASKDIQASSQIMRWLGSQYTTKKTTKQYLESIQMDIELQESRKRRPDDFGDELGEASDERPTFKVAGLSNLELSKRQRIKMALRNGISYIAKSAGSILNFSK
ncbi:hypothetical protein GUITHDRAFT_150544 [Guillardia theta CCMP2712]|uniref:Uncharacterized protein n=1 Tax=Guillardia theta (strain CCMP2712) TaxID=905079 RepID=L1JVR5_GUITC|nr:hypothetical protein GUITHDRAFT_150544 [Guillardia theta CCMP2712]EKX52409.1 hypothetical protein GUITHDRAFT_150544 [Guillardia theta CCMP2712]|mmetsp:Transcript_17148/g.56815  ORF Transcript_17148/g.56815 Transcript_17148/m.56815 type:complete len:179 (-) Transcript_17148:139-675(-)|eukprot:XP_005839389.1 hypothetical protein GUITHDRAFT_150544 [Guillardia theta CCMP2712]